MYTLGLSCFYHDSAAALLKNGEVIAAAHEERFTRNKQDESFPQNAVDFCLKFAGIKTSDLSAVAFYDKPFLKFERLLETYLNTWPKGVFSWSKAMPVWLGKKLWIKSLIQEQLDGYDGEIFFPEHHLSHAASAFYPSSFKTAAILTVDGVGEWATASKGIGIDNKITLTHQLNFPHSLGLLYSSFTYYTGFKVNSAEYKLMGLAPYGQPKFKKLILDNLVDLKPDGSFRLNLKYFAFPYGLRMTNSRFHRLFGASPTPQGQKPTRFEMDIAASIQAVTNEIMLKMTRTLHRETKQSNLCLAGGVALNCVSNGRILRDGKFKQLFVQPAAGDAGGALGAALAVHLGSEPSAVRSAAKDGSEPSSARVTRQPTKWFSPYLGPQYSNQEIKTYLDSKNVKYQIIPNQKLVKKVAKLIAGQQIIGWFQGRMEWGPRALGNRSILADPRNPENQKRVNLAIKFRESFRPFAPVVMEEHAKKWFDADWTDPYMITVCQVKNNKIPAVTHVDGSARIETVNRKQNQIYYDLINEFFQLTKVPVLINTSFNQRGEPIVCSPRDAFRSFLRTNMDYLVMGNHFVDKKQMPKKLINNAKSDTFEPD